MILKRTRPLLAASLGLLATLGCAEEREPISRLQPNALEKSFFVGSDLQDDADNPTFYANGTILDVGYGATQDGVFDSFYSNDLSIIRWQITEDRLIGRLAYERIDGSDGMGAGIETNDGQVIYAFAIRGHFDIQRSYNPSTGEDLNIIEENTSDRPWHDRKYFRVDWSRNLITEAYDFDTLAIYGVFFGGYKYEELGYYVNDPESEHAPNFEKEYFDVTTKAWAKPTQINLGGLFGMNSIPACFLDADFAGGQSPSGNCNPTEITIRHSFWQVQDTDYEPADWDGYRFQSAGAFTKDRYGFARNYGMVDTQWRRFISRYNIWQQSHFYGNAEERTGEISCSANTDANNDGTADACTKAGAGSQCNIFTEKCTLPYAEREVRPIVWYYTNNSDYRYFDPTYGSTQEWDMAMRVAIQAARNSECHRTGGDKCEEKFPVPHGQMDEMEDLMATWREVDDCRMKNGASDLAARWDTAACTNVAESTLAKRGYEAGSEEYRALRHIALMDDAVVLCHSPIEAGDHPLCAPGEQRLPASVQAEDCQTAKSITANAKLGGRELTKEETSLVNACKAAYKVRIGDVRRHLVNVIKTPQTGSPWGFGPTYASPLTGEAISASINVWAWPTDFISQSVVDLARFIGGELTAADVTEGQFVKDWDLAAQQMARGGSGSKMTRAEVAARQADMLRVLGRDVSADPSAPTQVSLAQQLSPLSREQIKMAKNLGNIQASVGTTSAMKHTYFARMQQAYGTETEAALVTPAMQQLAGSTNLSMISASEFASPLRGRINPTLYRDLQQMREIGLAARGACMLHAGEFAPSPTAMIGLTDKLQQKFGAFDPSQSKAQQLERAQKMAEYIAYRMHLNVMAHEMGHTFGLRHNFVSSSNAFNFRPQYWQLRTRNGAVTTECTDLAETDQAANNCVGPRYFDPLTGEENENLINMWSQSSIMEYPGDYSQDLLGLGAYDYHATRMFYGDVASVFRDSDMNNGQPLAEAVRGSILDSFGGILGYKFEDAAGEVIHYSQLQKTYNLIDSGSCREVNPADFKPAEWDEAANGAWDPTIDGFLVQVDGKYTRCKQRKLDFVPWAELKSGAANPNDVNDAQVSGRVGPNVDRSGRTRFPFGFATDRWADLGNLAVYRHDQGADPYELFEFFISEQELRHIFDNYRRNRQTFSVRGAANRILSRYNAKMRDGAKGLGLLYNIIQRIQPGAFPLYVQALGWGDNMLAAGMAFDHYTKQLQRPNTGSHMEPGQIPIVNVMNPLIVNENSTGAPSVLIPNGPQGFWDSVGFGGKLVNNGLSSTRGEYDSEFTINAGSYYDKVYTSMLMTESVDNFISSSLDDFTDSRFRSVSLADLFPDGYRRWLANNLTGDEWIKGARLIANADGRPMVDASRFPTRPMGYVSWWPSTPELCFPNAGTTLCSSYGVAGNPFKPLAPTVTRALDSQVGWEQQKFLIAWTYVYLPENQKQNWLDMMGIWSIGADTDPGFDNRIEFHMPTGDIYVARTYGDEDFCFGTAADGVTPACKNVQRGIGARVLEYANKLLNDAYVTTPVTHNGVTWYIATPDPVTGQPQLRTGATCDASPACLTLNNYVSVPDFMRQAMRDFGMAHPSMKGIYGG